MNKTSPFTGGCGCGEVRYHLRNSPLFVHACHCTDCQKGTGSAFGITTIILEADVHLEKGELATTLVGRRTAYLCESCEDIIYRTATNHPATALLRSRSLDDMRVLEIGAHIWTQDKHAWLELPAEVPQFDEGYVRDETWPRESMERLQVALRDV